MDYQQSFRILASSYSSEEKGWHAMLRLCCDYKKLNAKTIKKKYGIKTEASKCQLFKREICYLGHVISADWYTIDPKNVDAVLEKLKKKPNNITQLRNLLGFVGYFWRAIPNFSQIVKSLYGI